MPAAVSDASVLIHLARIGRLPLLRTLYERVVIPHAVWHETAEQGAGRPGARAIREAAERGWLDVRPAPKGALLLALRDAPDPGEAEALALAVKQEDPLVLLDEAQARKVAASLGLPITGTIGVLGRAKRKGLIDALRPELDALRREGTFWISEALYRGALEAEGEAPG